EELDGLLRREMLRKRACLQLDSDPPFDAGRIAKHIDPRDGRRATVGAAETLEDLDGRRLPRSVRPEHPEHLAALDGEGDPAHRLDLAVALPQVLDLHDGRHADLSAPRRTPRTRDPAGRTRMAKARPPRRRCAPRPGVAGAAGCR